MKGSPFVGALSGELGLLCVLLLMVAICLSVSSQVAAEPVHTAQKVATNVPDKTSTDAATSATERAAPKLDSASEKASPSSLSQVIQPAAYRIEQLGNVVSRRLREASGLALSTRTRNLAWSHNDSGYGPYLFAFDLSGEDRGRFFLEKTGASDWEDMDAFRWNDESWLLIADTGDNTSKKPWYTLYLVAEPAVSSNRSGGLRPLKNVQSIRVTYPTGPADTEAVAVDEVEQRIYLLTKRKRPVEVLTVPLAAFGAPDQEHEARFETNLFALPSPTLQDLIDYPRLGLALAQPNALDFSPDRSFAIVHTYGHSYRFDREPDQSWAQAFARAPKQIEVPRMKQGEAVAVGWDNTSLYYTSEGTHPPLYRLQPEAASSP